MEDSALPYFCNCAALPHQTWQAHSGYCPVYVNRDDTLKNQHETKTKNAVHKAHYRKLIEAFEPFAFLAEEILNSDQTLEIRFSEAECLLAVRAFKSAKRRLDET
jgi:hypothetical protein